MTTGLTAKEAALAAAAALPDPDPAPTVSYRSAGKTVVIGNAADALPWAERLGALLPVTVLLADAPPAPQPRTFTLIPAPAPRVSGWLGAFNAQWEGGEGRFDLVFDLSAAPLIASHQPPQGYFAPGPDEAERAAMAFSLSELIGEFEKPKFFVYKDKLCAHSRNRQPGCNACIDICSARAIDSAGDRIKVNPYLCAGCGACTTVCPSGALGYAYPSAPYSGQRLRAMLAAYARAGGREPVILFHSEGGRALLSALDEVPDNVMPVELQHSASVGIDVWLAAIAYGASGIMLLMTDEEAPQYRSALQAQMDIAQTVLHGLGYQGRHLRLVHAAQAAQLAAALAQAPNGAAPAEAAGFHVSPEKRNTLDFALAHLYRHAPVQAEQVALPVGSPFGAIRVDTAACSLCMSCVGACPSAALMDSPLTPRLSFVEKNCVQCGLCAATCPEDAITLVPRLSFADTWNKQVVLNESEPFCCIRCGKPFGTLQAIQNMLGKLAGHPAFSGNLDRLKMCGDCRVIDMMESSGSPTIVERKRN